MSNNGRNWRKCEYIGALAEPTSNKERLVIFDFEKDPQQIRLAKKVRPITELRFSRTEEEVEGVKIIILEWLIDE